MPCRKRKEREKKEKKKRKEREKKEKRKRKEREKRGSLLFFFFLSTKREPV